MGRPHIYGFSWEHKGDQLTPVLHDFQGNDISEMLGADALRMLTRVSQGNPPEKPGCSKVEFSVS